SRFTNASTSAGRMHSSIRCRSASSDGHSIGTRTSVCRRERDLAREGERSEFLWSGRSGWHLAIGTYSFFQSGRWEIQPWPFPALPGGAPRACARESLSASAPRPARQVRARSPPPADLGVVRAGEALGLATDHEPPQAPPIEYMRSTRSALSYHLGFTIRS